MSKTMIMSAAAASCITVAVAAGYYTSPAAPGDLDIPPILVNLGLADVKARLQPLSIQSFMKYHSQRDEALGFMSASKVWTTPTQEQLQLRFNGDQILTIVVNLKELGPAQTEVDIQVDVPKSKFSSNRALHPYDIKAIAAMADLTATDYVSSILKSQRAASSEELATDVKRRIGFDKQQEDEFGDRIQAAFQNAYGDTFRQLNSRDGFNWDTGNANDAIDAAEAASGAVEAARMAADAARDAAFDGSSGGDPKDGWGN